MTNYRCNARGKRKHLQREMCVLPQIGATTGSSWQSGDTPVVRFVRCLKQFTQLQVRPVWQLKFYNVRGAGRQSKRGGTAEQGRDGRAKTPHCTKCPSAKWGNCNIYACTHAFSTHFHVATMRFHVVSSLKKASVFFVCFPTLMQAY